MEHPNVFFNTTNTYLFFNKNKKQFAEEYHYRDAHIDLDLYLTWIVRTNSLLTLKTAIEQGDYHAMIDRCIYFLFNETTDLGRSGSWMFETNQFNKCFFESIHGITPWEYKRQHYFAPVPHCNNLQPKINSFLDSIEKEILLINHSHQTLTNLKYSPMSGEITWKCIVNIFIILKEHFSILEILPNGNIIYDKNIENIVSSLNTEIKHFIKNISCCIINDVINSVTHRVRPIMRYENNTFIGDWEPRSLLEAMYFELFIIFSQDTKIKKCPCCGSYFEISKTNSRRKYCSDTCNDRMAQRRRREKLKKIHTK